MDVVFTQAELSLLRGLLGDFASGAFGQRWSRNVADVNLGALDGKLAEAVHQATAIVAAHQRYLEVLNAEGMRER